MSNPHFFPPTQQIPPHPSSQSSGIPQSNPPSRNEAEYNCTCGTPDTSEHWICCDNADCRIGWYHWECARVTEKPRGEWFCPRCCSAKAKMEREIRPVKKGIAVKKSPAKKGKGTSKWVGWVEMNSEEEEEDGDTREAATRARTVRAKTRQTTVRTTQSKKKTTKTTTTSRSSGRNTKSSSSSKLDPRMKKELDKWRVSSKGLDEEDARFLRQVINDNDSEKKTPKTPDPKPSTGYPSARHLLSAGKRAVAASIPSPSPTVSRSKSRSKSNLRSSETETETKTKTEAETETQKRTNRGVRSPATYSSLGAHAPSYPYANGPAQSAVRSTLPRLL